jgi:DAACS family dicarboxylate/amino acid:cation (Na+ or H+) symporter
MKKHHKLLLGFVLGVIAGLAAYYLLPMKEFPFMKFVTEIFTLTGAVFLRMIFMVVVPLIVSALILGVFELSKGHGLGQVAGKSILYTLLLSTIAVFVAISLTGLLRPGAGIVFDRALLSASQSVLTIQKNVQAVSAKPCFSILSICCRRTPLMPLSGPFRAKS